MSGGGGIVAIGGGHGLAETLRALAALGEEPTAVVTVADDGGSSGRLRRDLGIIAVGDLRSALLALAGNQRLAALFAHRFSAGQLAGHPLGNLALLALAEQSGGDFVAALNEAAELLGCRGRALPCTTEPVTLRARVDGVRIDGQVTVAQTSGRRREVWLEPPDPPACPEAVKAITGAGLIVLGPGSLYTSIIANLLVPEIGAAVSDAPARIVYVANLTSQPGETWGMDTDDHVRALLAHTGRIDVVLLHDGPPGGGPGEPLGTTVSVPGVGEVHTADLVKRGPEGSLGPGHDPQRLAAALAALR